MKYSNFSVPRTGLLDTPELGKANPVLSIRKLQLPTEPSIPSTDWDFEDFFSQLTDADLSVPATLPPPSDDPTDVQQSNSTILNAEQSQLDAIQEPAGDRTENQIETEQLAQCEVDKRDLQAIDDSIASHHRTMTIKTQPPSTFRLRYKSDGKHYLENSRTNPTEIEFLGLKEYRLKDNQKFAVEVTMITTEDNPKEKTFIHTNQLECDDDDAHQSGHASFRDQLNRQEIYDGKKKFRKMSIFATKHDYYKFDLIPFDPLGIDNRSEIYTPGNDKELDNPEKVKLFRKQYKLTACRLVYQLMIVQNQTWHRTNIHCMTHIMNEKDKTKGSKSSVKRSASEVDDEEESEEENPIATISSPTKRKKPVTFVKQMK